MPDFTPLDDFDIPCKVRLWKGKDVVVFVHPKYWLKIGFSYSNTPIRVALAGKSFDCNLCRGGEWYADAFARDVDPIIFRLPTHGDYEATCRVIWSEALPEVLAGGLARSPELLERFRRMSLKSIREKVNWILRARKDSVRLERCLAVLAGLAD